MPRLFLNTERGFGGKPPKKSGFRRHLAGSKMPKETFFTAISRWRVVLRRALDAFSGNPDPREIRFCKIRWSALRENGLPPTRQRGIMVGPGTDRRWARPS